LASPSPGPLRFFMGEPNGSIMATLPWVLIPCFLVPLFMLSHLAVFYRLLWKHDQTRHEAPATA
jgi:hypothetical protein